MLSLPDDPKQITKLCKCLELEIINVCHAGGDFERGNGCVLPSGCLDHIGAKEQRR